MIKIKDDYDLFLEVNNFEYCLAGYSLDFIKSIAKNYKYHELIEKIFIRICYESSCDFANNLDSLVSYIDNKRKNINFSKEFNWKEIAYLEEDLGVDLSIANDNKLTELFPYGDYKEDKNKYILNLPLTILIHMLDYRSSIKNEDFNQFLDYVESIRLIQEFRRGINNLYKDNTSAVIKEIER